MNRRLYRQPVNTKYVIYRRVPESVRDERRGRASGLWCPPSTSASQIRASRPPASLASAIFRAVGDITGSLGCHMCPPTIVRIPEPFKRTETILHVR